MESKFQPFCVTFSAHAKLIFALKYVTKKYLIKTLELYLFDFKMDRN